MCVMAAFAAAPLSAQVPQEDQVLVGRADSLVEAGEPDRAIEILEEVVARLPGEGQPLYRLGVARYRAERFDDAADAFDRAAERGFRTTSALYNAASSFGRARRPQELLDRLERALEAGFSNKYLLLIDSDLDPIRDDPRWRARISNFFGTGDAPELSQPVGRIRNMGLDSVPMTDGTPLATEMVLPVEEGPFPTILVRTPYGRGWQVFHRSHWAARGYALVVQDVRGRGDSGGLWEPWRHERGDGRDTIEWIRRQPWSNGRIGMIGASYEAQVQWLAAVQAPEGLDALVPLVSGTDPFLDTPYDHGILKLSLLGWAHSTTHPDREVEQLEDGALLTLPLSDVDRAYFGVDLPIWNDWVRRHTAVEWRDAAFLEDVPRVQAGVLHVSGLWDVEAIGTAYNWAASRKAGLEDRWLVFGPWEHQNFVEPVGTVRGDVDYGTSAAIAFTELWVRWFDHRLKGKDVGWEDQARARVFVTGANQWMDLDDFPPSEVETIEMHLSDEVEAAAFRRLSRTATSTPATVEYRYDAGATPVQEDPTFTTTTVYPVDRDATDEVRFLTAPLEDALTVVGSPEVEVSFSTDAADADLFAFLLDMDPSGTVRAVGHPGKLRLGFREGWDEIRPLEPGRVYRVTIPMFPVAHRFDRGHRVALVIRGDWFPRYARNLGTAGPVADATETKAATHVIHVGGDRSSTLRLPVLSR